MKTGEPGSVVLREAGDAGCPTATDLSLESHVQGEQHERLRHRIGDL